MKPLQFDKIHIQNIHANWISDHQLSIDVLRLDTLHPVVSGNKYFKLKYYLAEAVQQNKKTIATFGGAYSNHIVATAYACKIQRLDCVGIIRGEKAHTLSHTLQLAQELGMELRFVDREVYRDKEKIVDVFSKEDWFWIQEGGFGNLGAKGAKEILSYVNASKYDYIIAAVGTGTMLAGLVSAAQPHQKIIGISSMKGNASLQNSVAQLLEDEQEQAGFTILHDFHFGGYAKHPPELIEYMNTVYQTHHLPLDIVYTAKTFFAMQQLVTENYFPAESNILFIHSGGLQGNESLPPHVLSF